VVKPKAWRRLWAGVDLEAVKEHLLRVELLIPDRNGDVPSVEKIQTGQPGSRFYVLAPKFFEDVTA
jgi:hypothetical protein